MVRPAAKVLGFEPGAQARIVDLRMALPEVRGEPALDLQVVQLQLNNRGSLGEIATNVGGTDMQSDDTAALGLCSDDHIYLLFSVG